MSAPSDLIMGPREWGMLIVLSTFWGGSFLFVGIAVDDFPAFTIAFLRVVIAAAVLWTVLVVARIELPKQRGVWASFLLLGAINSAVPFSLISWGQSHVASGLASVLIAMTPIFTVIAAHVATRDERLTVARLAGVCAGLVGVVVLIGPGALTQIGSDLIAQLAVLAAALLYGLSSIFARRYSKRGIPPPVVATGQVSAAAILLLPMVVLIDRPWQLSAPAPLSWAAIVSLGVVSTGAAYVLYFRVLATAGATNLMLVNFLVPVTAIVLGIVVLDEVLLRQQVFGMLLIAAGLALIDGRAVAQIKRLF